MQYVKSWVLFYKYSGVHIVLTTADTEKTKQQTILVDTRDRLSTECCFRSLDGIDIAFKLYLLLYSIFLFLFFIISIFIDYFNINIV